MKMEDHGCTVIKEANSSDHRKISYIISDDDGQTDNVDHKTCMQHSNNHMAISLGTDKERNEMM